MSAAWLAFCLLVVPLFLALLAALLVEYVRRLITGFGRTDGE
jgi:hypothetical protein